MSPDETRIGGLRSSPAPGAQAEAETGVFGGTRSPFPGGAAALPDAVPEGATLVRPPPGPVYGIPPGTLLVNTYRVERLLGGGGMGEVYLARHTGLGTAHAIKVIRPSMALDRQVMDLFYREAKVLRGVRHDAVVSYDGFVRDGEGRDYLVMEYVEGISLAERLRRGPLAPAEVWALRERLAAGLGEAHRKGAVHRDISPDNVVLPEGRIEQAKLIDFGVCKLTDPAQETILGSSFAGKYRYASPEQLGCFGGQVDARSDLYSLGLILAAAARGRPLDMGETIEASLRARAQVPDLEDIPAELRGWLAAMLEPDPAARPESLDALLTRWPAPGGANIFDRTASPTAGPRRKARTAAVGATGPGRPLVWVLGLALLAGTGGGLYWLLRPLPGAPPGPDPGSLAGPGPSVEPQPPRPGTPAVTPDNTARATAEPAIPDLVRAGRLDDAFARAQARLDAGTRPAPGELWSLAEALLARGATDRAALDRGFALVRELAGEGHGPAALALARMYDPNGWSASGSPFSRPNAAKAREWYRRADALGESAAAGRLAALDGVEEDTP